MAKITIMTADEVAESKKDARKRALKGANVANHTGAKSVHRRKDGHKRFGGKEKREAMRRDE